MSNVLRPNRNALAWLLSSGTNSPTAGSGNGACQPPWGKASLGSSSGPPGACITPSRVRNVWTVSFMSMQTERRTDSERASRRIASLVMSPQCRQQARRTGAPNADALWPTIPPDRGSGHRNDDWEGVQSLVAGRREALAVLGRNVAPGRDRRE